MIEHVHPSVRIPACPLEKLALGESKKHHLDNFAKGCSDVKNLKKDTIVLFMALLLKFYIFVTLFYKFKLRSYIRNKSSLMEDFGTRMTRTIAPGSCRIRIRNPDDATAQY